MARTVAIGIQDFGKLMEHGYFYVDKTAFIKEWWESGDDVTLIMRPRRFGKTLNMSMLDYFFSIAHAGRDSLFEGLSIWREEAYRRMQGTYPVISLSLADVKAADHMQAFVRISQILADLYVQHYYLLESGILTEPEKAFFRRVTDRMDRLDAVVALKRLSAFLSRYYDKKVLIFLDEYDTPMQEAYVYGYWNELSDFMKSMFHATFKTNPWLDRAVITGITRVSKESLFSDLNNLEVVSMTSAKYATAFGFTEAEVFEGLSEYGIGQKEEVKLWYDGFTFGEWTDIYNPWSVINLLKKKRFDSYWANTSSSSLAGKLVKEGTPEVKMVMEELLQGKTVRVVLDEYIVFEQLSENTSAIWSLLLAAGYLRVEGYQMDAKSPKSEYELKLTNLEVRLLFEKLIRGWFMDHIPSYQTFIKAMLLHDIKAMNTYMNKVALATFSYFDTGNRPSAEAEPERFYHGFVLGLMVDLAEQYIITSNRESGFGRYDVMLEPRDPAHDAFILEFKVHDPDEEKTLSDTVAQALRQIADQRYAQALEEKGIKRERIWCYGFAFAGKKVLIG
ncbi:MAG: ATP-binding protein [Eubacterium sp.]|nr:ATP-binding protein [Eubacterium sp.]